ncbi:mid1-interacting protein 1-like [Asterias rubens]|uniref:mid1-interacting protein 1-like n=1 Tax=Asterias rubens TaxID=7604 RepID=UPI001455B144|nr:mid1-interacting protein 1-like [Asterias rubens]
MELSLTDNERMSTSRSNQSILGVMKGFIDAVNEMDETVLIPSLLIDMQVDPNTVALPETTTTTTTTRPEKDFAVIPTNQDSVNLHTCYSMLKAVKSELIRGPTSTSEADEEEEIPALIGADNRSRTLEAATARAFREHLLGLFGVLQQLTDVSKKLTGKYQEELGDYQSCFIKPKSSYLM